MNKNIKVEFKRLIAEYGLEDLVDLSILLDEEVKGRVFALNEKLGLVVPATPVPVAPTPNVISEEVPTKEKAIPTTKEIFIRNCGYEDRETQNNYWITRWMKRICNFDKVSKEYNFLSTKENGVLHTTVCKLNPSLIGGQYAKDNRIWNFVFNPQHELPVFFGPCTKEFLGKLREEILKNIPEGYEEGEPIAKENKSDYGFEGRYYYDELTEDKFIFKTVDGYEGYNNGVAFNIKSNFDFDKKKEVISSFNILNYNYYFSHNYENAFAPRMKHLYPNMINEVMELMDKVNHNYNTFVVGKDKKSITTKVNSNNTTDKTNNKTPDSISFDSYKTTEENILAILAQNGIEME